MQNKEYGIYSRYLFNEGWFSKTYQSRSSHYPVFIMKEKLNSHIKRYKTKTGAQKGRKILLAKLDSLYFKGIQEYIEVKKIPEGE